jgi:hypothetical protein
VSSSQPDMSKNDAKPMGVACPQHVTRITLIHGWMARARRWHASL